MTASGSVPAGFDPKHLVNLYNQTDELIDGGVICNNPSLYAYYHAKHMLDKTNVKILSLGTAVTQTKAELIAASDNDHDPTQKLAQLSAQGAFDYIMNFESEVADSILSLILGDNYLRVNVKAPWGSISTKQSEMELMR